MDRSERVTRVQAAKLAGVTERTISRWAAAGRLHVEYERSGTGPLATYDPAEVLAAAIPHRLRKASQEGLLEGPSTRDTGSA